MLVEQITDVVTQLQAESLGTEEIVDVNVENVVSVAKTVYDS